MHFLRPATIKSIATQMVVKRVGTSVCSDNPSQTGGHAIVMGTFFNSGSGDPNDDVQALLLFNNSPPNDPAGVVIAGALLHWQGQFFGGVELGTVNVGQTINVRLTWDQANHRFVAGWTDIATGVVMRGTMPYYMPDSLPASASDKLIGVRVFPQNCLGKQSFADLEATFDNVIVDTSAWED